MGMERERKGRNCEGRCECWVLGRASGWGDFGNDSGR